MNPLISFNKNKWRKKPSKKPFFFFSISLLLLFFFFFFCFFFFFVSSYIDIPEFLFFNSSKSPNSQCRALEISGEKFLWFAPHSGFSNQFSELKNAILLAAILNRTLVVPPVLDHHAVVLGSCPKFRVSSPGELRLKVWDHVIELIQSRRYVSMANIVDLSPLVSSSMLKIVDFRVFASLMCGLGTDLTCFDVSDIRSSSLLGKLKQCGASLLSSKDNNNNNNNNNNVHKCLYALDEDCRTTVWTYKHNAEDELLDSFQPDEDLRKRKKISYVRRRKDIYKALGPGSEAEFASVLAFGSLFSAPYKGSELYIDIHESPRDQRIQSTIRKFDSLSFVPEILRAGKKFAVEKIKAPFLCAQLRLLDGQFKNHWKATFAGLEQKLESLKKGNPALPIHIFVMTDLPETNGTGNYLGKLAKDSDTYRLYNVREGDDLIVQTAKRVVMAGNGVKYGFVLGKVEARKKKKKTCPLGILPDILLYMEEAICSCASLGFVGTAGSTIAESIEQMRKNGICLDH